MEVTLDNASVITLYSDEAIRGLSPALNALYAKSKRPAGKGCGCKRKNRAVLTDKDFDDTRRALAEQLKSNPALCVTIKQRLNASKLRIKYRKQPNSQPSVANY